MSVRVTSRAAATGWTPRDSSGEHSSHSVYAGSQRTTESHDLFSRRTFMSASLGTAQQYLDKGLVFYNKGWLDEAISSYRMAIEMREGNFPRAHYQLARALLDAGDIGGAIEAFRTSIQQQSENPEAYYSLGLTLSRRGEYS